MIERNSVESSSELPDYTNEDVVRQIFERDDPGELKRYQEASGLSTEQIEYYVAFAKMRKKVHEDMAVELEGRRASSQTPSQEELSAGLFREMLEPQVRQAVFTLRNKGYPTYESGFYGIGAVQRIGVESDRFAQVQISPEVIKKLTNIGVQVELTSRTIELKFDKVVSLDEIQAAWDLLAEDLPDLGHVAEPSNIPSAEIFRSRVNSLDSTGK